tara:strand:+ start:329 stop:982 length:654 start_codon:yes stop_codon:yes gene_type:complete
MSDDKTPEELAAESQAASDAGWQTKLDALMADNERLTAKISESNRHTKTAEAKAAAEEKERLKGANDFEALFKSSELERETLKQQITDRDLKSASTSEDNAAMSLANELTKDTKRARILAKELKGRLKFTEDGVKVTDINGNLTVSSVDDLKLEVQKNPDYDFLIDGVDSSGGSASGSSSNGGATKIYNRAEFEALNPAQKMQVSKDSRIGKAEITD